MGSGLARGLKLGLLTGIMRAGVHGLVVYGVFNIPTAAYIPNGLAFSLIQCVLGGAAVGLVYGKPSD